MVYRKPISSGLVMVLLLAAFCRTQAWMIQRPLISLARASSSTTSLTRLYESNEEKKEEFRPFEFLNPNPSKIPAELKDEIYAAEANTAAAQDRGQRIALYALIAFVGILCAFFNGFLSELRSANPTAGVDASIPPVDLTEAGFGWVEDNFLFRFLFLNKIGGGICILGGAGAGLLAEAELDTKRINAEKIYEEMVRRREAKENKKLKRRQAKPSTAGSRKKGRRSGKERKRLEALSEVVATTPTPTPEPVAEPEATAQHAPEEKLEEPKDGSQDGGIIGKMKDLYDKADTMAASQALIMNKKLEDAGVIEKITDESGLKVVGREEAAKLQEEAKQKQDQKD